MYFFVVHLVVCHVYINGVPQFCCSSRHFHHVTYPTGCRIENSQKRQAPSTSSSKMRTNEFFGEYLLSWCAVIDTGSANSIWLFSMAFDVWHRRRHRSISSRTNRNKSQCSDYERLYRRSKFGIASDNHWKLLAHGIARGNIQYSLGNYFFDFRLNFFLWKSVFGRAPIPKFKLSAIVARKWSIVAKLSEYIHFSRNRSEWSGCCFMIIII